MENRNTVESIYWEKEIETISRKSLEQLQVNRLKDTVERVRNVSFYQKKFKSMSITSETIESINSIQNLPFTEKDDLRKGFPYGFLTVPLTKCIRLHSSSGTTGSAISLVHTKKDIDNWANLLARCFYGIGARESDIFQNMAGYGLFTGGLGNHFGSEKLGMLTVPVSTGNSKRQVRLMKELGTTMIHCMAGYAINLMSVFKELDVDPKKDTKLKYIVLGAESSSEEIRAKIEDFYGAMVFDGYGLTEMNGPGVSFECHLKNGYHVWEDSYIVEIIDPESDKPVPDGETGEIVFTTINREGMPIIRYRTRDLASIIPEPCPCGRTHQRLSRIQGRIDDMIIFKGVNIFPLQIEKTIMDFPELEGTYLVVLETENNREYMRIQAEVKKDVIQGDQGLIQSLKARIEEALQSEVLVRSDVQLVAVGEIPVSSTGKTKRVVDKRAF